MISFWPWGRAKANHKAAASPPAANGAATSAYSSLGIRNHTMPCPAIRWVGQGRIALRSFVYENDGDAVCSFQKDTYQLNFPDFQYTPAFADAFRYDLRRASLDPNHGIFVLDDGRPMPGKKFSNIAGFLWLVIAQNNWSGERYGYVNNLYITPERRGQGLGRELMKQSDEFFRSRGIRRVRLTVTQSNAAAVALYRASGYEVERWEMEKDL